MARRLLQTVACAVALRPHHQGLRQPTRRPATLAQPTTTTVSVDLGDRSYPIYIGDGLLTENAATASQYLQTHVKGSQVLIVTNEILDRLGYTQRTKAALEYGDSGLRVETLVLPDNENEPSEATKTLENLGKITDYAIEKALDRKATFVALGGGVIGDMVGFAAACYVRGVDFIQIPTTLMAMVDSSVGGKTAVNSKSAKNMVGAFYQPVAVVADVGSLRTLPDRELASGVSEVIKYGLIRDAPFFEWLEDNIEKVLERDSEALIETVEASCRNKAEVVALYAPLTTPKDLLVRAQHAGGGEWTLTHVGLQDAHATEDALDGVKDADPTTVREAVSAMVSKAPNLLRQAGAKV